jgi:hypothetical protein
MPIIKTKGAASSQGFGEFTVTTPPVVNYIEDVFSTYLYTGNGSTQTITNGIDLAGKGGLLWIKNRSNIQIHRLFDTARGNNVSISSDSDQGNSSGFAANGFAFNANGFSLGSFASYNQSPDNYVSWTFGERQKFFDVVTYTGDGVAGRQIAHNLGSAPGCIIVKCTSVVRDWAVWQRTLSDGTYLKLNTTDSVITNTSFQVFGDSSGQTSSVFTVGKTTSGVNGLTNANGDTYVAYLFAHDAGGFGLTGSDNVISCGSLTSTSGVVTVNLGYEPQWLMMKNTTNVDSWYMYDTMRGMSQTNDVYFQANNANAEGSFGASYVKPTATGFTWNSTAFGGSGENYIYIAIRRGPMKVPTLGTTVFSPALGSGTAPGYVSGFPVDLGIERNKGSAANTEAGSRLTGARVLQTNSTAAEASSTNTKFDYMNGFFAGTKGTNEIAWMFRRAPSFFDEVCYTGDGVSGRTLNHNLGVSPTMMIVKIRNGTNNWFVYHSAAPGEWFYLDDPFEGGGSGAWTTSATTFGFGTLNGSLNATNDTYVAYLFATCTGVSKVGSYTGTGTLQTVNCGFTSGARFVLIKRIIVAGDWYVYDSARGITSGNDPYLLINSTAAEVTGTNYVDTDTTGFKVTAAAPAGLNASGGTYIFLAIA